jgi:Tol biopolymer transport system component
MIVGTAAYMSPEQAEGKPVDSRSDIFSFGALLYEMVSGRRAFQRDSPMSTLSAVLREEPKPLEEVPHDVEKLITRCLRKDPVRRWQAMADLRVALRELCEESDSQPAGALPPPVKRDRRKLLAALLALPLLAAAGWLLFQYAGRKPPPPRLVHLTSYSGFEMYPSFSPDGRQVAFTWGGEKGDNWDIYVKLVGESNALRLTTDPAAEFWPAWSPEGKRIAFQRSGPGAFGIWLVSPLGGAEQKLADVRVTGQMSWSPDGKWLAVAQEISPSNVGDAGGLFLAPADGGEPRRLTNPKAPASDVHPSFSPSERLVAYVSCTSLWICDVFVQPLDSGYSPRGDPRRITRQGLYIGGLAWSRDGRSLIYSGSLSWGTTPRLWRVAIGGRKQPERLDLADIMATSPSVAPAGGRLAFSRSSGKQEVWRYRIGGVPEPFLTSSLGDGNPQFSPDGGRIVFVSSRTEVREIWVVNADGSRPVQLTKEIGRAQGTPRWSPDGRLIAFDSQDQDGQSHIYVVDANGGRPRRVGSGTSSDFVPSFSRDGKWIYFYSDRTGRHEVWRVPLGEGVARQMTENGGSVAFESTDGRTLFYWRNGRLFARSLDGGPERQVLDNVWAFAVFDDGIYYIGRPGPDQQHPIQFHEFSTGAGRLLTKVDGSLPADRFSVSPDRKTILFTKWTSLGADLMLIENFR